MEPPAAESWRSDPDARSWAREHATGWTYVPLGQKDYCPAHAEHRNAVAADVAAPQPTAAARDYAGNPLRRDEYAARLRAQLAEGGRPTDTPFMLTSVQAVVVARLLDELAGVYRGEDLAALAHELSLLLRGRQS